MSETIYFKTYYIITKITAKITNLSPLRVGAGKGQKIGEPDLPIIRTPDEKAVIPGSSLKGVVRNNLARFSNLDSEKDLPYVFGGDIKEKMPIGSSLMFNDFVSKNKIETVERAHININLATGGVKKLFQVEYVPEGNEFLGSVLGRNISLSEISGIIYFIRNLLNLGIVRIGGFKSRGYGLVNFEIDKIEVLLPSSNIKYKTKINIKGKEREIEVTANKNEITENNKYKFKVEKINDNTFMTMYTLNKESFYSVGEEVLKEWQTTTSA
jgi:CRISPR-associated protein Csm3